MTDKEIIEAFIGCCISHRLECEDCIYGNRLDCLSDLYADIIALVDRQQDEIKELNAEIDKYAVQTSSYNFPDIVHKGNVFNADFSQYKNIDWLIGGSPCTYWSIAQKSSTRETEASGIGWELFSQYVRALRQASPKYFIYENNKSMSNQIKESISATFGFEPICINSALVSAQNRQRLYWVGIRQTDGTYKKADIEQPEDRKIFLKDILDGMTDREKGRCIISSTGRTTVREYFYKSQRNMALEPVTPVCVAERGRYTTGGEIKQNYEVRIDGKTNTLTTVQKDNNVCEPVRVGSYPRLRRMAAVLVPKQAYTQSRWNIKAKSRQRQ